MSQFNLDDIALTVSWNDGEITSIDGLPYPPNDDDPKRRAMTTISVIYACRVLLAAVIERTGDLSAITALDDAGEAS